MNIRGNHLRWILGRVLAGLLVAAASVVVLVPAVPAQAAPANLWGFGFSNIPHPIGNHVLPPATEASSPPGHGAFVRRLAVGSYRVTFLGLGTPAGGGPGVVHLTAAPQMPAPVWCQARDWGPRNGNEVIDVICYQAQGAAAVPQDTDFSVAFSWWQAGPSAGPPFGYLESPGGNGTVTQYHSAGGPITSVQVAAGMWRVTMPGLGGPAPQAGSIQVTPATFSPEHCKVNRWGSNPSGQVIYVRDVRCWTIAGALSPADDFFATYTAR